MFAQALENEFAREVCAGLTRAGQKTLPCRYFYDDVGSALFEAITYLPEYGLTRADTRILQAHAAEIVAGLPANLMVAELGSGSGSKTRPILEEARRRQPVVYCPIDVSAASLAHCAQELGALGDVVPLEASYLDGLNAVAERRSSNQTLLILFLGSTIGNFDPDGAAGFLSAVRQRLAPGDALLLGADLVKPAVQLVAAYDDPTGVTAAFNLNLLARINRELGANFELRRFQHLARYNSEAQRIEIYLRARSAQTVVIRAADLSVSFGAGDTILTEVCHKFTAPRIREMARTAGFRVAAAWVDEAWPFSESLLVAI